MKNSIDELRVAGQSVWLDYIQRGLIESGRLADMVERSWIVGVTSNPTIFRKAIAGSNEYDDSIERLASRRLSAYDAFLELGGEDIRLTADVLRLVYEKTRGVDGYVSFEAQAGSAADMIAEARRMFAVVGRPNVFIKIPGVPEGIAAVEELIAEGLNINITLLFEVEVYEQFAQAYIRGLERRLTAGQPIDGVASVASFFISRVDTKVDKLLPDGSALRGRVAIANARRAYKQFQKIFNGRAWDRLAAAGARVQRPLWGSTGTKNPDYSDVLYMEELVRHKQSIP